MSVTSMLAEARSHLGLGEPNFVQKWYARRNGSAYGYNFPWCEAFITYVAFQSGNYAAVRPNGDRAYTVYGARDGERAGRWHAGTAANIRRHMKPGAIYYCDWDGSNVLGRVDHVGICERVLDDGRLVGIEGNTSDRCARRVRGPGVIAGFWNPPYTGSSGGTSTTSGRLLRRGMSGGDVEAWQNDLLDWDPDALPEFGADGDFGAETEQWTRKFQRAMNIEVDGVVGPQTRAAMEQEIGMPDLADYGDQTVHETPIVLLDEHGNKAEDKTTSLAGYVQRIYAKLLESEAREKAALGLADKLVDQLGAATAGQDWDPAAFKQEFRQAIESIRVEVVAGNG